MLGHCDIGAHDAPVAVRAVGVVVQDTTGVASIARSQTSAATAGSTAVNGSGTPADTEVSVSRNAAGLTSPSSAKRPSASARTAAKLVRRPWAKSAENEPWVRRV